MKVTITRKKRRCRTRCNSRLVRVLNLLKCLREGGVDKKVRAERYGVSRQTIDEDFQALRIAGYAPVEDSFGCWSL